MKNEIESYTFDNGPHCKGYGAVYGEGENSYGHDIISIIDGHYPEQAEWARNTVSRENIVVVSGRGGVAIRGVGYIELDASAPPESQKRAVQIAPGQWFRWNSAEDSTMVISMLTRPAFTPDQYETKSEDYLQDINDIVDSIEPPDLDQIYDTKEQKREI